MISEVRKVNVLATGSVDQTVKVSCGETHLSLRIADEVDMDAVTETYIPSHRGICI